MGARRCPFMRSSDVSCFSSSLQHLSVRLAVFGTTSSTATFLPTHSQLIRTMFRPTFAVAFAFVTRWLPQL